ncbi:MAG: hypothetical protein FJ095_19845 [Deltaproteobacteria bacterium]|nr:hypothetical protein [Deltaproteobacteria bacterium]
MKRPLAPIALTLWLAACSADELAQQVKSQPCSPGGTLSCTCSDGSKGTTTCNADGTSVAACTSCGAAVSASGPGVGGGGPGSGGQGGSAGQPNGGSGAYTPEPGGPAHPPSAVYPNDPTPDGFAIVQQVAQAHPDWLLNSCKDKGGNNEFMNEVARRLRQLDTRWGLNWKRGVVGDLSQDVVDYHYGADPSDGSTNVYIIDMITDHCGSNPKAGWIDVTKATLDGNTVGKWTLAGQNLGP